MVKFMVIHGRRITRIRRMRFMIAKILFKISDCVMTVGRMCINTGDITEHNYRKWSKIYIDWKYRTGYCLSSCSYPGGV